MKAIFGLGNPGRRYINNRHNIGYMVVEELAKRQSLSIKRSFRLTAAIAKKKDKSNTAFFIKPLTFMNNSGYCIKKVLAYHRLSILDILIVYDDVDLPLGTIRFKTSGSSAGHRGINSIISALGSEEFDRLRIGIGRPQRGEVCDHVLSDFDSSQQDSLKDVIKSASSVCADWLIQDKDALMKKYNRRGGCK